LRRNHMTKLKALNLSEQEIYYFVLVPGKIRVSGTTDLALLRFGKPTRTVGLLFLNALRDLPIAIALDTDGACCSIAEIALRLTISNFRVSPRVSIRV